MNASRSAKTYASGGSEGRRGRVVQLRLSQSRGSRSSSVLATVPFPTPPGPMSTNGAASAGSLFEQFGALLGAQALQTAALGDADRLHHPAGLHLAQTGE